MKQKRKTARREITLEFLCIGERDLLVRVSSMHGTFTRDEDSYYGTDGAAFFSSSFQINNCGSVLILPRNDRETNWRLEHGIRDHFEDACQRERYVQHIAVLLGQLASSSACTKRKDCQTHASLGTSFAREQFDVDLERIVVCATFP